MQLRVRLAMNDLSGQVPGVSPFYTSGRISPLDVCAENAGV